MKKRLNKTRRDKGTLCATGCGRRTDKGTCVRCALAIREGGHLAPKADTHVVPPDELARRIAYYAERFQQRLPLFADLRNAPFPVPPRYLGQ